MIRIFLLFVAIVLIVFLAGQNVDLRMQLAEKDAIIAELVAELEHRDIVKDVLFCESGYRVNVWGDLDKPVPAYGIAQFQKRTFYWLAKLSGIKKKMRWTNPKDQWMLLDWALRNNYGHLWKTCYNKARSKNDGTAYTVRGFSGMQNLEQKRDTSRTALLATYPRYY